MPSGFLGGGIGPMALKRRRAVAGNGLLNNLIAYWPLNEAGGANNALDLHTNALHLTQNSSPGADTGKVYATARAFDGSADYFSRAYVLSDPLNVGVGDFAIAAWVYPTSFPGNVSVVDKRGNDPGSGANGYRGYLLYINNSGSAIIVTFNDAHAGNESAIVTSGVALSSNAWNFVLAWKFSGLLYLSVNGGSPAQTSVNAAWNFDNGAAATVGYKSTLSTTSITYFPGRIGPVAMWKSSAGGGGVLSAAQRSALWNGGAGLAYADFTA